MLEAPEASKNVLGLSLADSKVQMGDEYFPYFKDLYLNIFLIFKIYI